MIYNNIFSKKNISQPKTGIYEDEDFDITQAQLETLMILEDSYFEINKNHLQSTYISTKDNNQTILIEGLTDFKESVITFFKNLLTKFVNFTKRIFMYLNSYIGDFEKFLERYDEQLQHAKPDFTIKGFNYTFKDNVPDISLIKNLIDGFNDELNDVQHMKKADLIKEKDEFVSKGSMNKIRAKILKSDYDLESENFLKTVKEVFRDKKSSPIDIKVDRGVLSNTIKGYSELKTHYKNAIKEKDAVIGVINSLKAFFEKGVSTFYKDKSKVISMNKIDYRNDNDNKIHRGEEVTSEYSITNIDTLNVFFNFKFQQAKDMGGICTTATIEKVNAIKEALKQSRVIIRKSLFSDEEENKDKKGAEK